MTDSNRLTSENSWILRISESEANYWFTYVVDCSLMLFFLSWDRFRLGDNGYTMAGLFTLGLVAWTLTEYCAHRWLYHLGFALTRSGHEKHHDDPLAHLALPWFVTPLLFLPPQLLVAGYYGVHRVSTFFAGWFAGFIAYSFMHHSLHHYKLKYAWFRHLQSQHRIHHALPETNYGVTMRFWDRVFRTEFVKDRD
ncbi:MAG TPA: sterol desaturase family protein [Gemmatimonadaceae bacterium]|nr:sterol desaturase family protein [Gemmatimonadaceae bacterium]